MVSGGIRRFDLLGGEIILACLLQTMQLTYTHPRLYDMPTRPTNLPDYDHTIASSSQIKGNRKFSGLTQGLLVTRLAIPYLSGRGLNITGTPT